MQYLGIDISKDKFDVALIVDSAFKQKSFSNDEEGFKKLMIWLSRRATEPVHSGMEATNSYWESLAEFLSDKGMLVSVINPGLIKKEAGSWGMRNKTDDVDAAVIARFCLAKKPKGWIAPSVEVRQLRDLVRHLDNLQDERQRHQNRLETASSDIVRSSLEQIILFLDAEIASLEKTISDHIDRHPGLKSQAQLLESIPGIGAKTTSVILSEMPDVSNFSSSKSAAAYAVLSPKRIQSGIFKGKSRLCKFGNARLRRALYSPAMVAVRFNPCVAKFYNKLLLKGKCKMSALCACMRKLLAIAYGVLKTGTTFEVPAQ